VKKLIIVCEEKLRQYGDFLAQLISLADDTGERIIGAKDGAVAAQVWTEKEYANNAVQISSEQYILFIGNSKLIKDKRLHMQRQFSEYGMQYGWLGKQGVLFIDRVVSIDDYDKFFEYAKSIQPEIGKLIEKKSVVIELPEPNNKDREDESTGFKKFFAPMKKIPAAIVNAPVQGINLVAKAANNKKIAEQEYSCLILLFYLKGLNTFLGLSEE